jgi:hypothetical protein
MIFLPQPPECWNYRCTPLHPACVLLISIHSNLFFYLFIHPCIYRSIHSGSTMNTYIVLDIALGTIEKKMIHI